MPVAGLKSTNNILSRQRNALKVFEEICMMAPFLSNHDISYNIMYNVSMMSWKC